MGDEAVNVLKVISVGAIAEGNVAGGVAVPVVMVDVSRHVALAEMMRVMASIPTGDCGSQWGSLRKPKGHLGLRLRFSQPIQQAFLLDFELPQFASSVDAMIRLQGFFLQHGSSGHLGLHLDERRIFIELPETGFAPKWEGLFTSAAQKSLRQAGHSYRESKARAPALIAMWRETFDRPWVVGSQRSQPPVEN